MCSGFAGHDGQFVLVQIESIHHGYQLQIRLALWPSLSLRDVSRRCSAMPQPSSVTTTVPSRVNVEDSVSASSTSTCHRRQPSCSTETFDSTFAGSSGISTEEELPHPRFHLSFSQCMQQNGSVLGAQRVRNLHPQEGKDLSNVDHDFCLLDCINTKFALEVLIHFNEISGITCMFDNDLNERRFYSSIFDKRNY